MWRWAFVAAGLVLAGCSQPGTQDRFPGGPVGNLPPAAVEAPLHAGDVGGLAAMLGSPCGGVASCERLAAEGDSAAQFQIGAWRYLGTELPRDEQAALRHFRQAAAAGNARAQHVLGLLYMTGDIVAPDRREGGRWLRLAAENGYAPSRQMLAHFGFPASGPTAAAAEAGTGTPAPALRAVAAAPPGPAAPRGAAADGLAGDPPLDPVALYEKVEGSVWTVLAAERWGNGVAKRSGSAVAVSERWLFTNCHVVGGADFILIKRGERVEPARLIAANDDTDRCVLETQARLHPVDRIAPYTALKVGQTVYTIGSPAGLENTFGPGMVTGLREWQGVPIIQTNAPISPGSSGGALFDAQGNLVGITTFTVGNDGALGFAVAADSYIRAMMPRGRG